MWPNPLFFCAEFVNKVFINDILHLQYTNLLVFNNNSNNNNFTNNLIIRIATVMIMKLIIKKTKKVAF